MGMPISIDIPNARSESDFASAYERLSQIDARFSTYKTGSELSGLRGGQLKPKDLSQELKWIIKACSDWEAKTGGYFSVRAGGEFDPSGYVKGWAIAEAGKAIEIAGFKTYCIGAGGDILARSAGAKSWDIGIQDPADKTKILNKLSISNGAVATSGNYSRGQHIFNPKTKNPASYFKSVSIAGPDIITADVLATAVFAAGPKAGRAILKNFPDYQALLII